MVQMDFLAANHVHIVGLWATVYKLTVVACVHVTAYYELWVLVRIGAARVTRE